MLNYFFCYFRVVIDVLKIENKIICVKYFYILWVGGYMLNYYKIGLVNIS